MSSKIEVNDLVMTVRWPHPHFGSADARPGTPFVVRAIAPCYCAQCGADLGLGAWTGVIIRAVATARCRCRG